MNKSDLLTTETKTALIARLSPYQKIGYPVVLSNVLSVDGLTKLTQQLASQQSVLVGPSGVGKSSIIAALTKQDAIRVGEVSKKGAGKHTTTATHLYHLPTGGALIDSPGVREFHLWPVEKAAVPHCFPEFARVQGPCKFRDCAHLKEPHCAIRAAIEAGEISPLRFASYEALMKASKV